jgi:hypothetical protein
MQKILLLCTLLTFETSFSQTQVEVDELKDETKNIMQLLQIDLRDSLQNDGTLKIEVMKSWDQHKDAGAYFNFSNSFKVVDANSNVVSYLKPEIFIRPVFDSVLKEQNDTSKIAEIYAKSILVHELTHFFQKTTYKVGKTYKVVDPINDPVEKEAYAVQAFYFLTHYYGKRPPLASEFGISNAEYRKELFSTLVKIMSQSPHGPLLGFE